MNYCATCDTIYYGSQCEEHGSSATHHHDVAMIDPNPRLSPGRVFPVQVDDVMVEAQIIATYGNEARVVVYGPGASGHVHAKTIPLEEIP